MKHLLVAGGALSLTVALPSNFTIVLTNENDMLYKTSVSWQS
jgi:sRNA-binding regulator protein Hfq